MKNLELFNKLKPEDISPKNFSNQNIKEIVESQDRLLFLLKNKDFSYSDYFLEFKSFCNKHDRFLYTYISSYILMVEDKEIISVILQNLESSLQQINQALTPDDNIYKMFMKFFDHCNLANTQRIAYNQSKEEIENFTDSSFDKKFHTYEKDITSQLISLISIFTALAFLIFGSINIFENLLENIKSVSYLKLLISADIWLICMSNLFIIFSIFICLMTNKEKNYNWKHFLLIFNSITIIILIALLVVNKFSPNFLN